MDGQREGRAYVAGRAVHSPRGLECQSPECVISTHVAALGLAPAQTRDARARPRSLHLERSYRSPHAYRPVRPSVFTCTTSNTCGETVRAACARSCVRKTRPPSDDAHLIADETRARPTGKHAPAHLYLPLSLSPHRSRFLFPPFFYSLFILLFLRHFFSFFHFFCFVLFVCFVFFFF